MCVGKAVWVERCSESLRQAGSRLARAFLVLAAAVCWSVSPAAAERPAAADKLDRLLMHAASEGPGARSLTARTAADAAAWQVLAGLEAPRIELQTEGRDASFGRELNAADFLRYSQPFRWPGSGSGALRDGLEEWQSVTTRAQRLEEAAGAASLWLEVAAETAANSVREARLQRIERALVIYRRRLELGEIAGSEVRQLELERGRDAAALALGRARVVTLRAQLESRIGMPSPPAEVGDLEALVQWLGAAFPLPSSRPDGLELAGPLFARVEQQQALVDQRSRVRQRMAAGQPTVDVEWERIPDVAGLQGYDALGVQLSVPLPLFGATRSRRAQADADRVAAAFEADLERRQLDQRFRAADSRRQAAELALSELDSLSAELPRTETSLAEQFRLGAISYLVFLDGFRRVDELRFGRIDVQLSLMQARLEEALLLGDASYFPLPATLQGLDEPIPPATENPQ